MLAINDLTGAHLASDKTYVLLVKEMERRVAASHLNKGSSTPAEKIIWQSQIRDMRSSLRRSKSALRKRAEEAFA